MGKSSSSSCFNIILCNSAQTDDILSTPQAKSSSNKCGWSFRRRYGKNRVLGNNVSSETTNFANKEAPQADNVEFQFPIKSAIVDEKPQLPKSVEEIRKPAVLTENYSEPIPSMEEITPGKVETYSESKISEDDVDLASLSNETSVEYKMVDVSVGPENDGSEISDELSAANESIFSKDESIELGGPKTLEPEMEPENSGDASVSIDEPVAIIIQTAMRSFLARKEFIQLKSAVKLQAVIRGNLVRRNAVATLHCIKAIVKVQALVRARSSKSLKNIPDDAQLFTMKLLQNSFTRQLLESTSKPNSLNIKCDPLRPNSAWSWLERWMAVSASEASKKLEPSVEPEIENENEVQKIMKQADIESSSVDLSESISLSQTTDSKFSDNGEKSMENEQCHLQKQELDYKDLDFSTTVNAVQSSHTQAELTSGEEKIDIPATREIKQAKPPLPTTEPVEIEQPKLSTKHLATSELKGEGKKFIYGSKKASNPAFIAAQSKFKEPTLDANSERVISPSLQESVKKTNELETHVAGSKCGTDLSISSTLDSSERSEIENVEACPEVEFVEGTSGEHDGIKQDYEANCISSSSVNEIPSITTRDGEIGETKIVSVDPIAAEVSPLVDEKLEIKPSNVEIDTVPETLVTYIDPSQVAVYQKHQENGDKSSLEASPISHRTVPESHGTPSSQASVKGKRNKINKHGSHKKRSSPSNPNVESSARSSTEHLPKDHKSGKRRNSFGSTKSDIADQEPGDSSSHNPLPSYMQATESARAKANSTRSSPDVNGKEVYSKKRHSLPAATGKQSSNGHLSTAQVAQGAKANGSHPSNERKWLR